MPTIKLRAVGMSYAIEGALEAGLDPEALLEALQSRHGLAVAAIGTPAETVLIDSKAETWNGLRAWIEIWVMAQGARDVCWEGHGPAQGEPVTDILSFQL